MESTLPNLALVPQARSKRKGSQVVITVFHEDAGGMYEVWTDTEAGKRDGRCLAVGATRQKALTEAYKELLRELRDTFEQLSRTWNE